MELFLFVSNIFIAAMAVSIFLIVVDISDKLKEFREESDGKNR